MTSSPAVPPLVANRRASDRTARRLGRAILAYLALTIAIVTLAPFQFQTTPAHGVTNLWNWSDLLLNVLLFVPIGFVYQLTRPRGAVPGGIRVLLLGACLSGAIELAQLYSPVRYSSPIDWLTNTLGAVVGAWLHERLARQLPEERAVRSAVRSLALELPLMGVVYQLVPLAWLVGLGAERSPRRWLVVLLATLAGAIVGTIHRAYVVPRQHATPAPTHASLEQWEPRATWHRRWRWLVALLAGWAVVTLPLALRDDYLMLGAALLAVCGGAVLGGLVTQRGQRHADVSGRFELPTLRWVMPLFASYLVLSACWPLSEVSDTWVSTWQLVRPGVALTQPEVFRALEQVAAFALVGYLSAEYHGRAWRVWHGWWPRLLSWTVPVALMLQAVRGFRADSGASASLLLLTQIAAVFGGWLYVLQRAHVQALVARRP